MPPALPYVRGIRLSPPLGIPGGVAIVSGPSPGAESPGRGESAVTHWTDGEVHRTWQEAQSLGFVARLALSCRLAGP